MLPIAVHGDMRKVLREMAQRGILIDACVTDPPYHLTSIVDRFGAKNAAPAKYGTDGAFARASKGFMGQTWDGGDIAMRPETWRAVFDVLRPGAHLVAFGGTRTWHRIACAIEDAGFELRDTICWLYGTGFPKSHDVAKSIDKAARGVPHGGSDPTSVNHGKFKGGCSDDNPVGRGFGAGPGRFMAEAGETHVLRGLVDSALPWQGWGTALKPGFEPIILARKPLIGTVAQNVLTHGTGAINIDACRIGSTTRTVASKPRAERTGFIKGFVAGTTSVEYDHGRWPANVIHDGSDEVEAAFAACGDKGGGFGVRGGKRQQTGFGMGAGGAVGFGDNGTASRFFYCAKANKHDRAGSNHPTVKPLALIRYLAKLITPPNGTIIDPFAGSGTTLEAAHETGFWAIGIENEEGYMSDIRKRIARLAHAESLPTRRDGAVVAQKHQSAAGKSAA